MQTRPASRVDGLPDAPGAAHLRTHPGVSRMLSRRPRYDARDMTESTTPTSIDTGDDTITNAATTTEAPVTTTVAPAAANTTAPTTNPYAPQPTAAPVPGATNGFSISSLILGIASIPTGLTLLGVAAIVLGFVGRSKEPQARAFSTWGIWLGFIGVFGWLIVAVLGIILAAPFALLGFGWGWGWWGF